MKILPMMSRGVVLVHEDGTFEMAPMQVWRSGSGQTVIRLGNNAYFFQDSGKYDGSEHRIVEGSDLDKALPVALAESSANKGLAPEVAYYPEGTPGHARETSAWPAAKHHPGGKPYLVKADDGDRGDGELH
jgi:hypothetical protein